MAWIKIRVTNHCSHDDTQKSVVQIVQIQPHSGKLYDESQTRR